MSAVDALFADNVRLAFAVANSFSRRAKFVGLDAEDVDQEALIALLWSARHYDPGRGVPFGSYSAYCIGHALQAKLSVRGNRRLPALPSEATEIGIADTSYSPDPFAKDDVAFLLAVLPARERLVIDLRFGLSDGVERTLEDVGRVMGVSKQRVDQLLRAGLERLRRHVGRDSTPNRSAHSTIVSI